MVAVRVDEAPILDGRLDDLVWQTAPVSADFLQRDPNDGDEPTERTEIRVVYDDEAIYFGVNCLDSEPDKI